ncbi:TIGR03826 family flagellar region protein [Peribacillus huizhouensis]|uniref:Flagellar operon protein (TIGR03826 family) n=1 Tax=Peribacillus huizhouensis TaxID=1501239 RepID=A0ABR6CPU0_9BACI|nr:TIGR03826 family flagellar region protein [Peribacillus huizhouensis]MBA9026721.1 flagellar operon protein (TIGR03826 family) [Peribacillus huizhouensis]
MELTNCANCNKLFVKSKFRDVCDVCFKEEEAKFDIVYKYIRKAANRTATMQQVVDGTGVEEELLIKFVKKGRLRLSQFPNLGYPCEKCGTMIKEGRICGNCTNSIRADLAVVEKEEQRKREIAERDHQSAYYSRMDE